MRRRAVRARRPFAFVLVLTAGAAACQLVAGIHDDNFGVPPIEIPAESSPPPPTPTPEAGPTCGSHVPPGPPDADDFGAKETYIFAIADYAFSEIPTDGGAATGYDLDHICSCDPLDPLAEAGLKTCLPPPDASGCDYGGGIDNALAPLFDQLKALATETASSLVDQQRREFRCGIQNILIFLQNYNGLADDAQVYVSATGSYGTSHPDGTTTPTAPTTDDCPSTGATIPAMDGSTFWSTRENFNIQADQHSAYVTNFKLVLDLTTFGGQLPFTLGLQQIELGSPVLIGDLVPLGADDQPLPIVDKQIIGGPPAHFRLDNALLAGRISAATMLQAAGSISVDNTTLLCDTPFFSPVAEMICGARDLADLPIRDGKGSPCASLSISVSFHSYQVHVAGFKEPLPFADAATCDTSCP